jgi:hypothetical protein
MRPFFVAGQSPKLWPVFIFINGYRLKANNGRLSCTVRYNEHSL